MATLLQSTGDMVDLYKQTDGNGRFIDVIEVLNDTSQGILDDWTWIECNQGTSHLRGIRTGLPSVSWGALYEGIPQSKSQRQNVTDTTGFVEAMSQIDERQIKLYADKAALIRSAEARPFMESMARELLTAFFYYSSDTNARHPKGLGARYGVKATSGAGNQIVDAGGTGSDNTSIWMVEWGYEGTSVIYPKGTVAGIQRENMGRQRVLDGDGNPYYVQEEMFSSHCGFTQGDYRRAVRIANVDVSEMLAGNVDLYSFMRKAYWKLFARKANKVMDQKAPGRVAIYANKDVCEALDALGTNGGADDSFIRLRPEEIQGREVMTYRGFPIRETDAILNTEARVV